MNTLRALAAFLCGVLLVAHVSAGDSMGGAVKRCGWFSNPTPANAWLLDREAEWVIGIQGGPQAEGDWPRFKPSQWVKTNGNYGYGCACMNVVANAKSHQISIIKSAHARSLGVCQKDRALKRPS